MDPALRELLSGADSEELEVILKLRDPQVIPPHVRVVAEFGRVVTGRIERRWIREVWEHPEVLSFKAPRLLQVESEINDPEAADDLAWREADARRPDGLEVTGQGVVIGLVDVGCDFAHPHFRLTDGSTRLLALWDQSSRPTSSLNAVPYGYGAVYSREDINRALIQPHPYEALRYHPAQADPLGLGAHGTLVLDIAAGNGRISGSPQGIAPDADLVFVHAATGVMGGLANLGDSVRILEAIDFIMRTANSRPCVINISMGRRGGSHDGLSPVEQGMDALLLQSSGVALVLSSGNYFTADAHASGQLRPGQERTLIWRTDKADITPNELEIWYSGKDVMVLEVRAPQGPRFRAAPGEDWPVLIGSRNVGHIYHRAHDPNNGDNQINIFLSPEAPPGDWQITLLGEDIVDGKFNAWVERDAPCPHCDSRFELQDADPYGTTGTLCNGFRTIAVGAYDGHSPDRNIASFSSCGPLRDFRQKPDLVAPGVRILGARSAPKDKARQHSWLTRMSGTSFAAPQVTGAVALMFEAAGRLLTIQETRQLLLSSTRSMPGSQYEAVRSGSGYLDIEEAVAAARRFRKEGLTLFSETRTTPEERSVAQLFSLPRPGLTMELIMKPEDKDRRKNGFSEGALSPIDPLEHEKELSRLQGFPMRAAENGISKTGMGVEERGCDEPQAMGGIELETEEPQVVAPEEGVEAGLGIEEGGGAELEEICWEETVDSAEGEEYLGRHLVELADQIIASGGNLGKPAEFLSRALARAGVEVLGDPLQPHLISFPAPETIWKAWKKPASGHWGYLERFLEVIVAPRELPGEPLRTGDILVRIAPGEPGLGHLALIAAPPLWWREELASAGLVPEGSRPGRYVQVLEGGARPHRLGDGFARRLLDEAGRLPANQLVLRLQSGLARIGGVLEDVGGDTQAEKCKQDWLKFLAHFPEEVREALVKQGPDAAVVVAIHSGFRDLAKLTDLSFYAKYGSERGYCPIQEGDAKYRPIWNGERMHVNDFLMRPSPPLVQRGGIKCHKVERKIEAPRPDQPGVNITGRYEHRYLDPADKNLTITDYTMSINQAGRHLEGFLTQVLRPDTRVTDRYSTRFHGDLQSDGRFLVYALTRPEETWGYLSYEKKGLNWYLYWQRMANDAIKPMGTKMGWVRISDRPTLMESAFSDQAFPPEGPVHDHERWPLTRAQIRNLVAGFAEDKIAPLLHAYFTTLADDRVAGKNALIDAAKPLHKHIGEVFTNKYDGIHLYDMVLGRYYVKTILSHNKWKFKGITRSQLDWIQIMLDVVTGYGFLLPNVTDYLGLKPTVAPGHEPVDPAAPPHKYKVSFSLKGLAVYYRGKITVEKTTGQTWKETFKITLKGFQAKPGFSISEEGEAETYHEWLPADIPGSVELVTGKLGGSMPGVKATAGAWFMHIFGSGYLPYMDVLGEKVALKLNLSKKFKMDIVNLGGLWGEIYGKQLPDKDYSKYVPVTDYAATYGLKDDVHFCLDSALLTEDARQALRIMCANELYAFMSPTSNLTIYGHTDRSADTAYNLKLSAQRAQNTLQAIRDILGDQLRTPDQRIIQEGKGETEAMNDKRPDNEVNPKYRRVDVILDARLVISLRAQ